VTSRTFVLRRKGIVIKSKDNSGEVHQLNSVREWEYLNTKKVLNDLRLQLQAEDNASIVVANYYLL